MPAHYTAISRDIKIVLIFAQNTVLILVKKSSFEVVLMCPNNFCFEQKLEK